MQLHWCSLCAEGWRGERGRVVRREGPEEQGKRKLLGGEGEDAQGSSQVLVGNLRGVAKFLSGTLAGAVGVAGGLCTTRKHPATAAPGFPIIASISHLPIHPLTASQPVKASGSGLGVWNPKSLRLRSRPISAWV
ncbi:hypothetical protein BDK51DRAFT_34799 [Blyttiomyces helicus]|uniref:Uncharacterized protein n=1 Tax=Blyttiomyces helicus TaxID=388810 RepID=A0A4P9WJK0_9FUNG|nr:hypothetical protein BDK51DRAFT_34799 [Blyttiomyces helicus]|eukprot:RKO92235.1 hypothetical protein BDK51DRAFT_34799 [Blyttiomyces helicus]